MGLVCGLAYGKIVRVFILNLAKITVYNRGLYSGISAHKFLNLSDMLVDSGKTKI